MFGAGFVATATGCGQKGPLYLPSEKLEELERKRDQKAPAKTGRAPRHSRSTAIG